MMTTVYLLIAKSSQSGNYWVEGVYESLDDAEIEMECLMAIYEETRGFKIETKQMENTQWH
jgi:hypothetical protein